MLWNRSWIHHHLRKPGHARLKSDRTCLHRWHRILKIRRPKIIYTRAIYRNVSCYRPLRALPVNLAVNDWTRPLWGGALLNIHNMVVPSSWLPFIYLRMAGRKRCWDSGWFYHEDTVPVYSRECPGRRPYMMADMMKNIDDPRINTMTWFLYCNVSADVLVKPGLRSFIPWNRTFSCNNDGGRSA